MIWRVYLDDKEKQVKLEKDRKNLNGFSSLDLAIKKVESIYGQGELIYEVYRGELGSGYRLYIQYNRDGSYEYNLTHRTDPAVPYFWGLEPTLGDVKTKLRVYFHKKMSELQASVTEIYQISDDISHDKH